MANTSLSYHYGGYFVEYIATSESRANTTYSTHVPIQYGLPDPTKAAPPPCVFRTYYTTSRGSSISDLSAVPNYFLENDSPQSLWLLHIEYNNASCPYRLALAELQPYEDWSLRCQLNNTCALPSVEPLDCPFDEAGQISCPSADPAACFITSVFPPSQGQPKELTCSSVTTDLGLDPAVHGPVF